MKSFRVIEWLREKCPCRGTSCAQELSFLNNFNKNFRPSSSSTSSSENPREYEPRPLNHNSENQREKQSRKRLYSFYSNFDEEFKKLFHGTEMKFPEEPSHSSATNRWEFNPTEETSEPPAKRKKLDEPELSTEERCVICLEKPRTHAFLHFGMSNQEVTSHFVACKDCANNCKWANKGCPSCRLPVMNIIKIIK